MTNVELQMQMKSEYQMSGSTIERVVVATADLLTQRRKDAKFAKM